MTLKMKRISRPMSVPRYRSPRDWDNRHAVRNAAAADAARARKAAIVSALKQKAARS